MNRSLSYTSGVPPLPHAVSNAARLAAVAATRLVGTQPEAALDQLATLAREALGARYAQVTIVDEHTSFWKACIGLDVSLIDRHQPVEASFCQYALERGATFKVDDARRDEATKDNPSVARFGVRAWAGAPITSASGEILGTLCVVDTEPREWTARDVRVLETVAQTVSREIELRTGLETASVTRRRLERLYDVSRALGTTTSRDGVATAILTAGREALSADGGALRVRSADGKTLDLVAATGVSVDDTRVVGSSVPADSSASCAEAVRTGPPVFLHADELAPFSPTAEARSGLASIAAVVELPLADGGATLGVLTLPFVTPQEFDTDDREFLSALSHLAAHALGRSNLDDAEREARGDTVLLQRLTAGLSRSLTIDQVTEVAVRSGAEVLRASAGVLSLLSEDAATLTLAATFGYDDAVLAGWGAYPVALETPTGLSVRTGEPVYLETPDAIRAQYPDLIAFVTQGDAAWASVPLTSGDRTLGVLFYAFPDPTTFGERERQLMTTISQQTCDAVQRALLHAGTEREGRRVSFVNAATLELDAVSGTDARATVLARLLVPSLADFSIVELRRQRGPTVAATAFDDPALGPHLKRWRPDDETIPSDVDIAAERAEAPWAATRRGFAAQPSARALLTRLEATSYIATPLLARGKTIGRIVLGTRPGRPPLTDDDLTVVNEIARHAALSVENARLYEEERQIAKTLQQGLLPAAIPAIANAEVAVSYLPAGDANDVGGDFYDVFEVPGGWMALIGDVCGKGAEAAKLTAMYRYTVRALSVSEPDAPPSRIVEMLNEVVLTHAPQSEFCSLVLARLEPAFSGGLRATCCVAGHPPPILVRANSSVREVQSVGGLVGVSRTMAFGDVTTEIPPGDRLVLLTDGLPEARRNGVFFGEQRVRRLLSQLGSGTAEATVAGIERELLRFADGSPQRDDVAVVVVRCIGDGIRTDEPAVTQPTVDDPATANDDGTNFVRSMTSEPGELALMRAALRGWLRTAGVHEDAVADLVFSSNELCANAIEHAYLSGPGRIDVLARREGRDIVMSVRDRGAWKNTPSLEHRGRGLGIARALVDEFDLRPSSEGTEVRLRKVDGVVARG